MKRSGEVMSSVAVFEFENQNVETITLDNNALFNHFDIGNCLGIEPTAVRNHLAKMNDKQKVLLTNSDVILNDIRKLANRGETFLTESGVYKLIMKSRVPSAEKFQDWICEEVLPKIRRTGLYNVQKNRLVQNLWQTPKLY
jgi:prophage antirepressor-like protein